VAGFRLWESVTIEQLLRELTEAAVGEFKRHELSLTGADRDKLEHRLKDVLNTHLYASPACGTSSLCQPSEEGRADPWSAQSASWGLVTRADPTLAGRED